MDQWVWTTLGVTFAVAGIALAAWALFWDRSRGRRRCPKCWYSMDGTPGVARDGKESWVCPECGREIRAERELVRPRRNWRLARIGGAVALVGLGFLTVPWFVDRGWTRLCPTDFLVRTAPMPAVGGSDPLSDELLRRLQADSVPLEQRKAIVNRAMQRSLSGLPPLIETRTKWVSGLPLRIRLHPDDWLRGHAHRLLVVIPRLEGARPTNHQLGSVWPGRMGDPKIVWQDEMYEVGTLPPTCTSLVFDASVVEIGEEETETLWSGPVSLPMAVYQTVDEILTPVGNERIEREIRAKSKVGIRVDPRSYRGGQYPPGRLGADEDEISVWIEVGEDVLPKGMSRAFRIEIRHDDEVVATSRFWFAPSLGGTPEWYNPCEFDGDQRRLAGADPSDPAWTVRVSGDPEMALRDTSATSYWSGSFSIPLGHVEIQRH